MKIFVSAIAFDNGRSGISNYIENTIKSLSSFSDIDVLINESDKDLFVGYPENVTFLILSEKYKKAILNVLWHLIILPFSKNFKKYDFIFLPAGNRRLMAFYPIKTIVTMHDLSQFRVPDKYDTFRMFYIKHIIPFFWLFFMTYIINI